MKKLLPVVSDDEKSFTLSNGWAWCRLQDVTSYVQRGKGPQYADSGKVRVVSQKCIQWAGFDLSQARYVEDASLEGYQPERFLRKDDLLWNSTGTGTAGRINVIPVVEPNSLVADSHVTIVRPLMVSSRFLSCYISAPGIQQRIEPEHENSLVSGTTNQVELNLSSVVQLAVPIPPMAEQHRIVAKVDELMALCDQLEQQQTDSLAAHQTLVETLLGTLTRLESEQEFSAAWARIASHFDTLFTTEASIDHLKQTILQLAVMGKLVPQDPNDEAASVVLRQCFEQKSLLIEHGKARAEKPLPQIDDDEKQWTLPPGWEWERLGNIFNGGSGTTPLRSNATYFIGGTEKWFKTTDLNLAVVMEGEEKITKQAVEECNLTYYPPGTVCIAMYGGAGTIGKSGILGVESTINQSVFALPPVEQILPEYLHIFVRTVRDKWMQFAAGLRKDPNINGLIIKKMVMPVPPKSEQRRIVAKVDELIALCDALKARLADAQSTQIHLADAIVERAVC